MKISYPLILSTLILLTTTFISPTVWAFNCHITSGWEKMASQEIALKKVDTRISMTVRIADQPSTRAAGYQWICDTVAAQTAILFIFPQSLSSSFHMRNVFVPINIHFFDATGKQVSAMVMRPEPPGMPLKPRNYHPSGAFRYALEIAQSPNYDLHSIPPVLQLIIDGL